MNQRRLPVLPLLACLALPIMTAIIGAIYVAVTVTAPSVTAPATQFVSVAKLKAGAAESCPEAMKQLGGMDLQGKAQKRALILNEQLKDTPRQVTVSFQPEIPGIAVSVQSVEPRFCRAYLDALLDEFIALQPEAKEGQPALASRFSVQERASPALEVIQEWKAPLRQGALMGALVGLALALPLAWLLIRRARQA